MAPYKTKTQTRRWSVHLFLLGLRTSYTHYLTCTVLPVNWRKPLSNRHIPSKLGTSGILAPIKRLQQEGSFQSRESPPYPYCALVRSSQMQRAMGMNSTLDSQYVGVYHLCCAVINLDFNQVVRGLRVWRRRPDHDVRYLLRRARCLPPMNPSVGPKRRFSHSQGVADPGANSYSASEYMPQFTKLVPSQIHFAYDWPTNPRI